MQGLDTQEEAKLNMDEVQEILRNWQCITNVGLLRDVEYSAYNGRDIGQIVAERAFVTNIHYNLPGVMNYFDKNHRSALEGMAEMTQADYDELEEHGAGSWFRCVQAEVGFFGEAKEAMARVFHGQLNSAKKAKKGKPVGSDSPTRGGDSAAADSVEADEDEHETAAAPRGVKRAASSVLNPIRAHLEQVEGGFKRRGRGRPRKEPKETVPKIKSNTILVNGVRSLAPSNIGSVQGSYISAYASVPTMDPRTVLTMDPRIVLSPERMGTSNQAGLRGPLADQDEDMGAFSGGHYGLDDEDEPEEPSADEDEQHGYRGQQQQSGGRG